jgi:hypothetical protein
MKDHDGTLEPSISEPVALGKERMQQLVEQSLVQALGTAAQRKILQGQSYATS